MKQHQRRLPHWDAVGQPTFVTFRLHGSLPANRLFPPGRLASGKTFVAMDRLLDRAATGPSYLRQPRLADLVTDALRQGEARFRRYQLHAFVIMPNHVHILATPNVVAARWLGPLKGFTVFAANCILGRLGQPFWQDESYDHLIRTDTEFDRVKAYIEDNPVKAGLAATPGEFAWSSAATAA